MFGTGLPELALVLLALVAVAVLLGRAARGGAGADTSPEAAREARRVGTVRVVGLVLGLLAAAVVWSVGSYGTWPMLAPAALGLCVVLASALGETVERRPRPTGPRVASLRPRRVGDYLAPVLGRVVAVELVATVVLMVLTTATASRDAGTGTVRALACSGSTGGSSVTPYPGSHYTLPLAATLLVVLAVAATAARQVVLRPRGLVPGGETLDGDDGDDGDDALRRRSLDVVVAAVGVAVGAPYAGLALTAGHALGDLGTGSVSCAAAWMHPVGQVLVVSAIAAVVAVLVCVGRLLAGPPRVATRRPAPVR